MVARRRKENESYKAYRNNLINEEYAVKKRRSAMLWDSRKGTAMRVGLNRDGRLEYISLAEYKRKQ